MPFVVSSCLMSGEDTIVLPQSEEVTVGIDVEAIPLDVQQKLEVYMPIHEGTNPPIIDGVYLMSPLEAVYASDNGFNPGDVANDYVIRFTNQNAKNHTLSYAEMDLVADAYGSSDDVTIIGHNNNFTTYFISSGISSGVSYKETILISGTWTMYGIQDIYYAFVMVDKGYDPNGELMNENEFRVFKDSDRLAENSVWSKSAFESSQSMTNLLHSAIRNPK